MFSSTIVATSARRACVIHEIGNSTRRMRIPMKYMAGMIVIAIRARTGSMDNMKPKARMPIEL